MLQSGTVNPGGTPGHCPPGSAHATPPRRHRRWPRRRGVSVRFDLELLSCAFRLSASFDLGSASAVRSAACRSRVGRRSVEPFFFGPNAERFGVFHAPTGAVRNKGVLIVPPLFNDYMRTHRVLRQVALRLSERGFAALRFDFRGTGDSFGDLTRLTHRDWVDDVSVAIDELREIGMVEHVAVLGVRFGVPIVAEALAGNAVDAAVFWDPPAVGQRLFDSTPQRRQRGGEPGVEFQGFLVGKAFVDAWADRPAQPSTPAASSLVLTSGRSVTGAETVYAVDVDCAWEKERLDEPIYSRDLVETLCKAF
jgi:pimeloyl-ACP methyl ester carboxylesterase